MSDTESHQALPEIVLLPPLVKITIKGDYERD